MTVNTKFKLEDKVKHRLNEFEGFVVGIVFRDIGTEYEVLPLTDCDAKWVNSVWIAEKYLEAIKGGAE